MITDDRSAPRASSTPGRIALERGPVVYCLEGVDHPVRVTSLALPRQAELREQVEDLTGEVILLANGIAEATDETSLYRATPPTTTSVELRAVPYATWANRGQSDMAVWIRETDTVR